MTTCPVCSNPLTDIEVSLNQPLHYNCRKCATCGDPIANDLIEAWLAGKGSREHLTCRDARLEKELLTKEVTITQSHLDFLNRIRLLAWYEPDATIAGNSTSTEQAFRSLRINELPLEDLYKFLSKYTTVAALVSIVIAKKKEEINTEATTRYREKTQYEKEQEKTKTRTEEIKKAQLQAERLDPKLRERRKAIEGLKRTFPGMTDQQIEEMLGGAKGQ